MKKSLYLFILVAFWGCKSDEEVTPSNNADVYKLTKIHGEAQTAVYNTFLSDSLVVKATDSHNRPVKDFWVKFEATGGEIFPDYVKTDSTGFVYAKWKAGCNSDKQFSSVYLLDSLSQKVDSVSFTFSAIPPTGWGKACGTQHETTSISIHPNGMLFAISGRQKLMMSSDRGKSWSETNIFPTVHSLEDVEISSNGDIVIATDLGILVSENEGSSWYIRNNGISDYSYLVEVTSLPDSRLFFCSYNEGLYRSADGGKHWDYVSGGLSSYGRHHHLTEHPDGTLYVINNWGYVYQSTDGGDSWTRLTTSPGSSVKSIMADNEGNIYLATSSPYPELFKSSDKGVTWEKIHQIINNSSCYQEITGIRQFFGEIYFYATCDGVYRHDNGVFRLLDPENEYHFNDEFVLLSENEMIRGSYDGIWYNYNLK